MSLEFKLRYDQLHEGDPTKPETAVPHEGDTLHEGPSHARNLCLVWPDGRRQFASYAYLVGGIFTPGDEINEISLTFSDSVLTLRGYGLEPLFIELLSSLPKQLMVIDKRYALSSENTRIVITEAVFQKKD